MTTYIIRRLIQAMIVLVIVTSLIFLVMRLLPADPLMLYIAENELTGFTPEQMEALIHEWGLDKPLPVQYYEWISGVVTGDLGESIIFKAKVSDIIAERLPITLHLGILSFMLSSIAGILAGVVSALRRGTWIDNTITPLANLGITTPAFWIGILMIYLFALKLQWLPVFGYTSPFEDFWLSTRQSIMPVFVLSLMPLSLITRQTRSSILEVLQQDYIRTAWAKGLRERVVVLRHTIKNALIPVITIVGIQVRIVFGGTVLTETVFNIPGIGRMMVEAVLSQDYQLVQSGLLVTAVAVLFSNLIVDISYGWFDPRIQYE